MTCPVGAVCRLDVSTEWFDNDPAVDWYPFALTSFSPYGDRGAPAGTPQNSATCNTGLDGDRCFTKTTVEGLGHGQPLQGRCGLGPNPHGPFGTYLLRQDAGVIGTINSRHLECTVDVHQCAGATARDRRRAPRRGGRGTDAGALTVGAKLARPASSRARAAHRRVAAFSTSHRKVKTAGPVTIVLKPNAAARKLLQRRGRLAVKLAISFTSTNGKKLSRTAKATLRRGASKRALCQQTPGGRRHTVRVHGREKRVKSCP